MRSWRHIVSCFALFGVLVLSVPAAALATSAGDQQYIDPLAGSTTPTSATPPPRQTSTASPAPAPTSSSNSSSVSSTPTATTAASSSNAIAAAPAATATTLPYTGLNLWLCAALGCGLLGTGWTVRRLTRSS